jgi:hypothetical protein
MSSVEDIVFDGGVVRKLRYSDTEFAILDASAEVVGVNWTTRMSASDFVLQADKQLVLKGNARAITYVSPDSGIQVTEMEALRVMAHDLGFRKNCEFVRMDVSVSQSAYWEILPQEGRLTMAGFGARTYSITEETVELVEDLVNRTATPEINSSEIVDFLLKLPAQHIAEELRSEDIEETEQNKPEGAPG